MSYSYPEFIYWAYFSLKYIKSWKMLSLDIKEPNQKNVFIY